MILSIIVNYTIDDNLPDVLKKDNDLGDLEFDEDKIQNQNELSYYDSKYNVDENKKDINDDDNDITEEDDGVDPDTSHIIVKIRMKISEIFSHVRRILIEYFFRSSYKDSLTYE